MGGFVRLSGRGHNRNFSCRKDGNSPLFLKVSFAPTTPNEINAPIFMRKFCFFHAS